jgi:hypothetical protein
MQNKYCNTQQYNMNSLIKLVACLRVGGYLLILYG